MMNQTKRTNIYSVIRCHGRYANKWINEQLIMEHPTIYGIQLVGGKKDDIIIWFSRGFEDLENVTEAILLSELDRLGKGREYPECTVTRTREAGFQPISGTIPANRKYKYF